MSLQAIINRGSREWNERVEMFFFSFRLRKWCRTIFPESELLALFMVNFPLLIGVMQHASGERGRFSPFEYHAEVLQRGDLLIKPQKTSRLEKVLDTLRSFRQEWHRHQQFLVPVDVTEVTGMCPDVWVEITKYLSLNDAINAFSLSILPLLRQAHSKVQLDNPPDRFVQIVGQHLDPRQIASVRIIDDIRRPTRALSAFRMFDQLVSVTVFSEKGNNTIGGLLPYFPTARYVAFWFAFEFDLGLFTNLRHVSSHRMTHLHIHCTGVCFVPFRTGNQQGGSSKNTTITSFILDSTYKTTNWTHRNVNGTRQVSPSVKLPVPMKFIASLSNVRRVRLIVNPDEVQTFLEVDQWEQLISECQHLQRVTIQLVDGGEFTREVVNIERALCRIRPGISFRIKTV